MINCLPPRSEVIILKFHVKKSLFRSLELTKYSYPPPAANFLRVAARLVICVAAFTFRNRKGQPREVRVKQLPEIHWTTANLPNSSVCPFRRNLLILFGIILLSSHVARLNSDGQPLVLYRLPNRKKSTSFFFLDGST